MEAELDNAQEQQHDHDQDDEADTAPAVVANSGTQAITAESEYKQQDDK
jgi:hypothetical protein